LYVFEVTNGLLCLPIGNSVQYEGPCRLQCPVSLTYKPVCSSENVVYANMAALKCAAMRNPERSEYDDKFYKILSITYSLTVIWILEK
jgi:hypothetical protein